MYVACLPELVLVEGAEEPERQQLVTVPVGAVQAVTDGLADDPTPEQVRHLELRTLIRDERVVPGARPERWLAP